MAKARARLEPIEGTYVAVRNANVRAKPDVDALKVTMLAKGSRVHVAGKVASRDWLAVDRDGERLGYVYSKLLQDLEEARAETLARAKARRADAELAARAKRNEAVVWWDSIKESKNRAAFRAYLVQYPKGRFAPLAHLKLEELKPRQLATIIPPKVTVTKPVKPAVGVYKSQNPGETFKDCKDCPDMVVIPPGRFRMGDLSGGGTDDEKPVHDVRINYSFAVGKFEVTWSEWDACVHAGGCNTYAPEGFRVDAGWGRGRLPVINVSWDDARAYNDWLGRKTGKSYRLLSEAEWEYVARSGSASKYSWGDDFDPAKVASGSHSTKTVGSYGHRHNPVLRLVLPHTNNPDWFGPWHAPVRQQEGATSLQPYSLVGHLVLSSTLHPDCSGHRHALVRQLGRTTSPQSYGPVGHLAHPRTSNPACSGHRHAPAQQRGCTISPPSSGPVEHLVHCGTSHPA